MNAIIRLGNGAYYTSPVFGYYDDTNKEYSYEAYYIVMDRERTRLVRQPEFDPVLLKKKGGLDRMVLIYDADKTGWSEDERGLGGVDFLSKKDALSFAEGKPLPAEILTQCRGIDRPVDFSLPQEIKSTKDIDGFLWATGGFHDAEIDKIETAADGAVSVFFDGIWGCTVQVVFKGDVSYDVNSRTAEDCDHWWFSASIVQNDGFFYLIDDEDVENVSNLDGYCWFKGRSLCYRLTPL